MYVAKDDGKQEGLGTDSPDRGSKKLRFYSSMNARVYWKPRGRVPESIETYAS